MSTSGAVVRGQNTRRWCIHLGGPLPSDSATSIPESSPIGAKAPDAFGSSTLIPSVCGTSLG